jgi:hypothetical protein
MDMALLPCFGDMPAPHGEATNEIDEGEEDKPK